VSVATQRSSRAVVQWDVDSGWGLEDIVVDPPAAGEVLVRVRAAGLCRSDHHLIDGGYTEIRRPVVPGHEGAGVVEEVGPGVEGLRPGDHVLFSVPVPACGTCPACLRGLTYLCEEGQYTGRGMQVSDGTSRHHAKGQDLSIFVFLGTFAEYTVVHHLTCIKIDPGLAFERVCTIGCAGVTGWGAVQNTARTRPGETVVVLGVGGVGANSLMAARFLGAKDVIAVDPIAFKRESGLTFGANHAVSTIEEAHDLVGSLSAGRMADVAIMAMGEGDGTLLGPALDLLGKRGRAVVVNVHPEDETQATVSLKKLQGYEKQVLGCANGSWHGRHGGAFLIDLQQRGLYDPGLIVTRTYPLERFDEGYADQTAGRCVRAVVVCD
jgi:NDMA-dependent alcohol dehydrogenase